MITEELVAGISLSLIIGILVKVSLVILTLLALVTVRQAGLMDRVVSVPIGNWFKGVAWGFFWACLVLTTGVILIV